MSTKSPKSIVKEMMKIQKNKGLSNDMYKLYITYIDKRALLSLFGGRHKCKFGDKGLTHIKQTSAQIIMPQKSILRETL